MAEAFLRDVEEAFAFLRDEPGYELLEADASGSFDNAWVSYRSARLRVRITRERGQVFADFAPPDGPPDWFDASTLLGYLGSEALVASHTQSDQRSLPDLAYMIQPFCDAIAELFAASRREYNVQQIHAFRDERSRLRWG